MIELVGERLHQRLDILRQRSDLLHARVERVRQFVDAVGERVEPGRTGALSDVVDAGGKRLHVSGQRRDTLGRGDARGKLAQLGDRRLQVAQRLGIGGAGRDAVHLAGQFGDARVEARQAFGRRHGVEPLMHLGKAALDRLELRGIGAAAIAAIDPLGEQVHVALQVFQRPARQGVLHGARNIGEVAAQGGDRVFDAGRLAQRLRSDG